MNWMHVLYWVLGIIGYLLVGGVVVWIARKIGLEQEYTPGDPLIITILFFPSPLMAIVWPLSVLGFIVLRLIGFLLLAMNGFEPL